jgi:cytochrome aa3-600 menaquinol oxidase subunit 3
MEQAEQNTNAPLEYQSEIGRLNILGFWIFLGAEIVLFSSGKNSRRNLANRAF